MENDIYKTPEADVEVPNEGYIFAGFWIRVVASLIDTVLFMMVLAPVLTAIYGTNYWAGEQYVAGIWDVILNYLFPAVAIVVFWVSKSATPGKMAVKVHIVDAKTGGKIGYPKALARYFCYYLSLLPLGLGLIWVAFDERKQGFHDKIAGTYVVRGRV